jgi:hypothetical protein
MPTDTAPIQMTATVITSGAEAIRTAREFAASIADGVIERDRSGPAPVRELAALDASGLLAITVPRKYHHIGNYLLNDVLPPNHGQI